MSWNINVYAVNQVGDTWQLLFDGKPICVDYKHYMLQDYNEFLQMSTDSIVGITTEYNKVAYCELSEFIKIHHAYVSNFYQQMKVVYRSLGLQLEEDCGSLYESSFEEDSSNDYMAQLFSMMTFPVNKNLIRDLTSEFNNVYKSLHVIGLCNMVSCIAGCDDIRLVFVTC